MPPDAVGTDDATRPATPTRGEPISDLVSAAGASLALLAHPTRVRMLWALRDSEPEVSSLAAIAGVSAHSR